MFNIKKSSLKRESGNAAIMGLAAVAVVAAIGAFVYFSGQKDSKQGAQSNAASPAAGQQELAGGDIQIKPGNPVVAKVGKEDVTRVEVFNFIQTLPPSARQLPIAQLFPAAMEQVINAKVIERKTKGVNLDDDPEVKKQLATAKENIVRNVYIEQQVSKRITDERLKQAYELYKSQLPEVEEVRASHILVKEEKLAKDLLKQLKDGADFATLAKENSVDGTAKNGGEIGYFAKTDVVPQFGEAAFSMEKGEVSSKPVETEFGFHIIKLEDKRLRPPAEFEEAKPFLEAQLRRAVLDEVVSDWREASSIKRFDINGEEIEPAAGGAEEVSE